MLMHRNGLKTPNEVLKAVTPANASDLCHPRGDSQRLMQNSLQVRMSMSRDWWYFAMIELNCTTKSSSCWCLICAIMGSTNYRSFPLVPADTHHVHKHSREFVEASFVWGDMHVSFPRSTNHCEIATHSWTLGAGSLLIPESRCWAFPHLACILLLYLVVLKNPRTNLFRIILFTQDSPTTRELSLLVYFSESESWRLQDCHPNMHIIDTMRSVKLRYISQWGGAIQWGHMSGNNILEQRDSMPLFSECQPEFGLYQLEFDLY